MVKGKLIKLHKRCMCAPLFQQLFVSNAGMTWIFKIPTMDFWTDVKQNNCQTIAVEFTQKKMHVCTMFSVMPCLRCSCSARMLFRCSCSARMLFSCSCKPAVVQVAQPRHINHHLLQLLVVCGPNTKTPAARFGSRTVNQDFLNRQARRTVNQEIGSMNRQARRLWTHRHQQKRGGPRLR